MNVDKIIITIIFDKKEGNANITITEDNKLKTTWSAIDFINVSSCIMRFLENFQLDVLKKLLNNK